MTRTRRILVAIVVIFAIYAVLNSPTQSAGVVDSAWEELQDGLGAVGTFFDTLIQG